MTTLTATPTRPPLSVSQVRTAIDAIRGIAFHGMLTTDDLTRVMSEAFGATSATGAWNWRMAYDVMQAAALAALKRQPTFAASFDNLEDVATHLLTETRRSEGQIRLQQFSTPLPYAATVVAAACVQ